MIWLFFPYRFLYEAILLLKLQFLGYLLPYSSPLLRKMNDKDIWKLIKICGSLYQKKLDRLAKRGTTSLVESLEISCQLEFW